MTYQVHRISLREQIAPHFWQTFKSKELHQIDKGGRGSTKTSKNATKIPYHLITEDKCSAVCIRKYQNTLRNSVYKEIKRGLKRLGLEEGLDYTANLSPLEITLFNGNKIYFAGADDYEKIKGMIDEKTPIKIVWFEEITEFDGQETLDQIVATFSRGNNDWFSVLYSYNPPKNKFDWVNQWADEKKREGYQVTDSDYRTVPVEWLGSMFIQEAERLKKFDEKRYNWMYLGEVIGMEGLIYNYDHILSITSEEIAAKKLKVLYVDFAIDVGYSTSATTVLCIGYLNDGRWVLLDTYYYSPKEKPVKRAPSEIVRDIHDFQKAMIRQWKAETDTLVIDSADGATRSQYFLDYGERLTPVKKQEKQIMIDFTQNFLATGKFYVLMDCPNNKIFLMEAQNYMWKEGSVEKGRPEPDKSERELKSTAVYYNTHSKDYAYYCADHTADAMQYYVVMNKQKLGLRF